MGDHTIYSVKKYLSELPERKNSWDKSIRDFQLELIVSELIKPKDIDASINSFFGSCPHAASISSNILKLKTNSQILDAGAYHTIDTICDGFYFATESFDYGKLVSEAISQDSLQESLMRYAEKDSAIAQKDKRMIKNIVGAVAYLVCQHRDLKIAKDFANALDHGQVYDLIDCYRDAPRVVSAHVLEEVGREAHFKSINAAANYALSHTGESSKSFLKAMLTR